MNKNTRYQIVYLAKIWTGLEFIEEECLCKKETASGTDSICIGEEEAKQRVAELHAIGETSARYEELPYGTAWFDNKNWIG